MTTQLKIDFVSDISCPWCIIGLRGLEEALKATRGEIEADIHFHPYELNPVMEREGENMDEHIKRKFGERDEGSGDIRKMIRDRAADLGFAINHGANTRIYNTRDAHRLLHWAGEQPAGRQQALKHALFEAYFTNQRDVSDPDVLADAAAKAGLDRAEAAEVIASGRYNDEVREAEHRWQGQGIQAVPAIVVNDRYLISGGQPADAFERALRSIAAETTATA